MYKSPNHSVLLLLLSMYEVAAVEIMVMENLSEDKTKARKKDEDEAVLCSMRTIIYFQANLLVVRVSERYFRTLHLSYVLHVTMIKVTINILHEKVGGI